MDFRLGLLVSFGGSMLSLDVSC